MWQTSNKQQFSIIKRVEQLKQVVDHCTESEYEKYWMNSRQTTVINSVSGWIGGFSEGTRDVARISEIECRPSSASDNQLQHTIEHRPPRSLKNRIPTPQKPRASLYSIYFLPLSSYFSKVDYGKSACVFFVAACAKLIHS